MQMRVRGPAGPCITSHSCVSHLGSSETEEGVLPRRLSAKFEATAVPLAPPPPPRGEEQDRGDRGDAQ